MTYAFTFILAFCSIVYELLLGQSLSAFLGNTVLRYSVTIGLYMLSMGIGALLAEGRLVKHPVVTLLKVEIALTITGGFSVIFLMLMNSAGVPDLIFFGAAHFLIILIGVLTGFEIPLMIELRNLEVEGKEQKVLGIDYLGAFVGTVVFALFFYPVLGLIPTSFAVAIMNAFVGVLLFVHWRSVQEDRRREYGALLGVQAVLFAALMVCINFADAISNVLMGLYLGA